MKLQLKLHDGGWTRGKSAMTYVWCGGQYLVIGTLQRSCGGAMVAEMPILIGRIADHGYGLSEAGERRTRYLLAWSTITLSYLLLLRPLATT